MLLAVVVESRSSFVVFIYFIYDYRFEVIQSISQIITTNLAPPLNDLKSIIVNEINKYNHSLLHHHYFRHHGQEQERQDQTKEETSQSHRKGDPQSSHTNRIHTETTCSIPRARLPNDLPASCTKITQNEIRMGYA